MSLPPQNPFGFCATCGTPHTVQGQAFCPTCGSAQAPVPAAPAAAVPPPAANPYQAAAPTPPGAPPVNPYYAQPAWNGMPQGPAPARSGISPAMIIGIVGGIVILALVIGLIALGLSHNNSTATAAPSLSALATPTATLAATPTAIPTVANTGVVFSPSTVDCAVPVDFTTTIHLPASLKSADTLTLKFDGKVLGTATVGDSLKQQTDLTWSDVTTEPASTMQKDCANGGKNSSGAEVLTTGTHTYQILDKSGTVLAEGSYTVTGTTPIPQPTSTPALSDSTITYSPATVSCAAPVEWTTTIRLPASVLVGDTIVEKLDGTTIASEAIKATSTTIHEADGTWTIVDTSTAAAMQTVCSNGGMASSGLAVLTPGTHVIQVFDSNGLLISAGAYSVSN
jgi:hypothetical protein